MKNIKVLAVRSLVYVLGLFTLAVGIIFAIDADLGVSR